MTTTPADIGAKPLDETSNPEAEPNGLATQGSGQSKSMHDGVPVWCDCCSCEAEPYWLEIAAQAGMDPGVNSDADNESAELAPPKEA